MSTPPRGRKGLVLPPWLLSRPVAPMSRRKAPGSGAMVTDRVMVGLTAPERAGLDRITEAAKRAGYPLSEVDVMRKALDRLLADFEAAQQTPAAGTQQEH